MTKNGISFIVMALLVAELFKILICAGWMTCDVTMWTQIGVESQINGISLKTFSV